MPFACALTEGQYNEILDYVKEGGTIITGPWFAVCDELGENPKPLGDRILFPYGDSIPMFEEISSRNELIIKGILESKEVNCCGRPLYYMNANLNEIELNNDINNSIISRKKFGEGNIIQMAVDIGGLFRYTKSKITVDFVKNFLKEFSKPLIEIDSEGNLILGVFKREDNKYIIHIQNYSTPWDVEGSLLEQPKTQWKTTVKWNGVKPKSIRCALPEVSPALTIVDCGKYYEVTLPPFVWGQVLIVEI